MISKNVRSIFKSDYITQWQCSCISVNINLPEFINQQVHFEICIDFGAPKLHLNINGRD